MRKWHLSLFPLKIFWVGLDLSQTHSWANLCEHGYCDCSILAVYPFVLSEVGIPHGQRVEEGLKMGFLQELLKHYRQKRIPQRQPATV